MLTGLVALVLACFICIPGLSARRPIFAASRPGFSQPGGTEERRRANKNETPWGLVSLAQHIVYLPHVVTKRPIASDLFFSVATCENFAK